MKYFVTIFDKRAKSTQQLQDELNNAIANSSIHTLNVTENQSSGDVLFEILTTANSNKSDKFNILSLQNIHTVSDNIKEFIKNIDNGEEVKAVKLLPLGGQRALGIILTTRENQDSSATSQQTEKTKPDKKANGLKNSRTKS